jgi:sugar/nucleoside kinase (ribokinase family)
MALPQGSNGTIPVAEAKEQTANWTAYLEGSDLITKAFLFSMDTFTNLIERNTTADGIRVYLALKTAGDPTSMTALLVPTFGGNDLLTLPKAAPAEELEDDDDDDDSNIYNYSTPCPPLCDDGHGMGG